MKQLTCEMCGSSELVKEGGFFVCQTCGTKYSTEEAKKMMIEGTVDVQGTVKVDNSSFVEKYLNNARRALEKEDWEEVEKYYNMVEQNSRDNMEAVFFSSYGRAMLSMVDSDYFKREQKFKVLNKSMSVISDYYDTTTENKEEVLRKIVFYIKKMSTVTFVYNRQSFDLSGALRSYAAVTGSRKWCIQLLDSTKKAFVKELREIAEKHDEEFIKNLIEELEPTPAIPTEKEVEEMKKKKNITLSATLLSIYSIGYSFGCFIGCLVEGEDVLPTAVKIIMIIFGIFSIIYSSYMFKVTKKKYTLIMSIIGFIFAIFNCIFLALW